MTLRLPCALDRAQVGPERFDSKGASHNSYRSINSMPGGEKLASVGFTKHLPAACGMLADGNRVPVHLAPRTKEDTARLPEVLPGPAPARLT